MPLDFMPMPDEYSSDSSNRESCILFFTKLFSVEDIKEKISQFSPEKVKKQPKKNYDRKSFYDLLGIEKIQDHAELAEVLYDVLGPHFLYEVQGSGSNSIHSRNIRYDIIKKAIDIGWFNEETVFKAVASMGYHREKISELEKIRDLNVPGPWTHPLLSLFSNDLPSEVVEPPAQTEKRKNSVETITAIRDLMPLHDYQIFAGKKIRNLLAGDKTLKKRMLISIPTGAGKTRLVAEALIDWLNDGKPFGDKRIHNAKYMIWIAQSRELCEQAISQFQEIYAQKGQSALTIFRFSEPCRHIRLRSQRLPCCIR